MANLDWLQCPTVESIPGKVSGAWVERNPDAGDSVIENLEAGMSTNRRHSTGIAIWFCDHLAGCDINPPADQTGRC